MSQKIRTVKQFTENNNSLLATWEETGLLYNLNKKDSLALVNLLQEILFIYNNRISINEDKSAFFAFSISRICFSNLDYLIKNPVRFVHFLDTRVTQEEILWSKVNLNRDQELAIEAEFCQTVANEVKAMKL